jgi:carboxypeptidase T
LRQQYSSYQECIDFFEGVQNSHPDLFRVKYIGETWEKRRIMAVTLSKGMEEADAKPALFYTGTIHAREWIGVELAIAFAKYVLEYIDYDPQLNDLLSRATFYLVPCVNPDGFEFSRTHFSFWRKNRRQNADGSFGVDLNRNFSVGFAPNKNTASNVYPGPAPFSEPETLALKEFTEAHPNISIALDYHSQGNVFFPAHNFIHEDADDATDLNALASNMAEEIRKVSGREYGIHMGKPPTHLISGSGREFYYAQGALSLVVEVGSRNISDYIEHMTEHINEQIPALVYALSEVPNYSRESRLPRIANFVAEMVTDKEAELRWEYDGDEEVYFEIYRSRKVKGYSQRSNRIGMTRNNSFVDRHLLPATNYYYFIRAICRRRRIKSPFAPVLGIRTTPEFNMFSKEIFPLREEIGYVGEKTVKNKEHFGNNSLFVGISEKKGECFGVCSFSLETIPENAIIKSARIFFYPMNRVSVQVERFGEWRVGLMDERTCDPLYSFDEVKNAKILGYIDRPTSSYQLSQGVWRAYRFAKQERNILQEALKRRKVVFRMEGPTKLPLDRASQLMQWDIGYGRFSGGLTFRPKLEVTYTLDEVRLELTSQSADTVSKSGVAEGSLQVGFDADGSRSYGCIEFDLSQLPEMENTVISEAYVEMEAQQISAGKNLRYHLEMVTSCDMEKSYDSVRGREVVERIGYDVSVESLNREKLQRFIFDRYATEEMVASAEAGERLFFVLYASSDKPFCKGQSVEWLDAKGTARPHLVINYIKRRRSGVGPVENLRLSCEKEMIRLDWDNPEDDAFRGVIVVKNRFHVPCTPYDGQKLYGGRDSYTFDNFGDVNTPKYYAVFTYDDVPNLSEATYVEYRP